MTDALITELSQIKKLRVMSRTTVMQYKHTQKTIAADRAGIECRRDCGRLGGARGRSRAHFRETGADEYGRVAVGRQFRAQVFTDVLALQSDVATAIARGIQVELSSAEQSELARNRSVVPEAYEAYLKGRFEIAKRTQEGFLAAEEYFKKAVRERQHFRRSLCGLRRNYMNMSSYQMRPAEEIIPKAKEAAAKALQLDEQLGGSSFRAGRDSLSTIWNRREWKPNISARSR